MSYTVPLPSNTAARSDRFDVRRSPSPLTLRVLSNLIGSQADLRGARVLDLGCGAGFEALMLAEKGARVLVSDLDLHQVAAARERLNRKDVTPLGSAALDAHHLPFRDGIFDLVLTQSVLMYMDRTAIADEIFRCLKPGGRWLILEHLGLHPLLRMYRVLTPGRKGVRWVNREDWELLERKFRVLEAGEHYLFAAPAEVLFRLGMKRMGDAMLKYLEEFDRKLIARNRWAGDHCWIATRVLERSKQLTIRE